MIKKYRKTISSYALITLGTILMSAGINMIYEPMSMVTGGFAGIGIILQEFFPIPLWVVTLGLNVPLFIVAAKKLGFAFVKKTLYAAICYSLALALVPRLTVTDEDYLMAALMGGSLTGSGLALVFRQSASTGGSDLLGTILKYYIPSISTATFLAVIDGVIVLAGMVVFGVKIGLYSIVAVFITSKLLDSILDGLKFAKMLYIISDSPEQIARGVMEQIGRGVTALEGEGMYSGNDKKVLMCAVSRKEAVSVLKLVREADRRAFVIVSDAREVMGEGF